MYRVIEKLQEQVPDMLCKLEMIFPPGFFTPMLHLIVHLANEALLGGPVQYHWQFCIELEFKYIRYKCGNKNKIEACIAEATLLQEMADATMQMMSPLSITRSLGTIPASPSV